MSIFITRLWRKAYSAAAERMVKIYLKKDRNYSYKGLQLKIYKDVFHPGLFRSTRLFAEWLESKQLHNLEILELGCGSALLSLVAARNGANVTAVDINPKAVENAKLNAQLNALNIKAVRSDLFTALPDHKFDIVLINPPYFPKEPRSDYEHAWFCGEHFEYFENLFTQLVKRSGDEGYYMIVSDSCDLASIRNIAVKYRRSLIEDYSKKLSGEHFFIFRIIPSSN